MKIENCNAWSIPLLSRSLNGRKQIYCNFWLVRPLFMLLVDTKEYLKKETFWSKSSILFNLKECFNKHSLSWHILIRHTLNIFKIICCHSFHAKYDKQGFFSHCNPVKHFNKACRLLCFKSAKMLQQAVFQKIEYNEIT